MKIKKTTLKMILINLIARAMIDDVILYLFVSAVFCSIVIYNAEQRKNNMRGFDE